MGPVLEIDSGMRILLTSYDQTTEYAIVYAPPAENPPPGFTSGRVYYYVMQELPRDLGKLVLTAQAYSDRPGFAAANAVWAPSGGLANEGSAPPSSKTLWVPESPSWAVDWQLSGTGTSVTGTVTWWSSAAGLLSISKGVHELANDTAVNAGVTYSGADTPTMG